MFSLLLPGATKVFRIDETVSAREWLDEAA